MMIKLHGGKCCGAKHIHGMGAYPEGAIYARKALTATQTSWSEQALGASRDMAGGDKDFFNEAAPIEKYIERFDRLIEFLKNHRPHHMVDMTLCAGQHTAWKKYLEDRDWKQVAKWKNSNTSSTLYLWVLTY